MEYVWKKVRRDISSYAKSCSHERPEQFYLQKTYDKERDMAHEPLVGALLLGTYRGASKDNYSYENLIIERAKDGGNLRSWNFRFTWSYDREEQWAGK